MTIGWRLKGGTDVQGFPIMFLDVYLRKSIMMKGDISKIVRSIKQLEMGFEGIEEEVNKVLDSGENYRNSFVSEWRTTTPKHNDTWHFSKLLDLLGLDDMSVRLEHSGDSVSVIYNYAGNEVVRRLAQATIDSDIQVLKDLKIDPQVVSFPALLTLIGRAIEIYNAAQIIFDEIAARYAREADRERVLVERLKDDTRTRDVTIDTRGGPAADKMLEKIGKTA